MGDNARIHNFRMDLKDTINKADLPIEVKRMVVSEFMVELDQLAQMQIQKELSESEDKANGIQ